MYSGAGQPGPAVGSPGTRQGAWEIGRAVVGGMCGMEAELGSWSEW